MAVAEHDLLRWILQSGRCKNRTESDFEGALGNTGRSVGRSHRGECGHRQHERPCRRGERRNSGPVDHETSLMRAAHRQLPVSIERSRDLQRPEGSPRLASYSSRSTRRAANCSGWEMKGEWLESISITLSTPTDAIMARWEAGEMARSWVHTM